MIDATLVDKTFSAIPSLHPKIGDEETFRRALAFLTSINRIDLSGKSVNANLLNIDSNFSAYLQRNEPAILSLIKEAHNRYSQVGNTPNTPNNQTITETVYEEIEEPNKVISETKIIEKEPVKKQTVKKEDIAIWIARSRKTLAEATGYPEDMLGEDLDLEADLGIDSVQRAEIWGILVNEFELDKEAKPAKIKTLTELATELQKIASPTTEITEQIEQTTEKQANSKEITVTKENLSVWIERSRKTLAHATGYPEDMLGENLDLEADLGIDSVQRAEIWGTLVNEFELDKEARPAKIKTLTELATELLKIASPTTEFTEKVETTTDKEATKQENTTTNGDVSVWIERSRKTLADATGYPEDMLGENLDLEADLGIDSVQRAEIWGTLVNEFELDKEVRPAKIRTLTELATELLKIASPTENNYVQVDKVTEQAETTTKNETTKQENTATNGDISLWIARAKKTLAEATGYPEDMLGENLDLEADLGIDSVQRAEIWGTLVNEFELDKEARPAKIRTLTELATELLKIASPSTKEATKQEDTEEVQGKTKITINKKETDEADANVLFYSNYSKIDENKIEKFDCKKILTIISNENDVRTWNKHFKSIEKQAEVLSITKFLEIKDISKITAEIDSIIILSHNSLLKSKLTGTKLSKKILESTLNLYKVFRKLADFVKKEPVRIICPIAQDGAFGAIDSNFNPQGSFPAGFIRSLQHELPNCKFQLIDAGKTNWKDVISKTVDILLPFHEAGLVNNEWIHPVLMETVPSERIIEPVAKGDLVLVTGGARGIVYKCVAEFAKRTNCKLLLTGRTELPNEKETWLKIAKSDLAQEMMKLEIAMVNEKKITLGDAKRITAKYKTQYELFQNMQELKNNKIDYIYKVCDVQNQKLFSTLIKDTLKKEKIKGIVHGAGVQKSQLFDELTEQAIELTIKTKLEPLFILSEYINFADLKLLFGFGSIAGLFGNSGQSDYALGNDVLACAISSIGKQHNIFAQTIEWTAWTGTGMVSDEEAKRFQEVGLVPLTVKRGVELFLQGVLGSDLPRLSAFNEGAIFTKNREISKEHIPARPKEILTTDNGKKVVFSLDSDLYINQHLVQYKPVVPGTFTTEIFLEALTDKKKRLENITFKRPLWVRDKKLQVEILQKDNKMLLVPQDRPENLKEKALDTLSYATCELGKIVKIDEKKLLNFSQTIKTKLTKLAKENTTPFYSKLDKQFPHILSSGPIFRGVKATIEEKGLYYSYLELTDEAIKMFEISGKFIINPVVADMAIQTAAAWGIERIDVMAIPFGIGKLNVLNKATGREAIVICKEHKIEENRAEMDLVVREIDGKVLFTMDNVVLKTM